MANSPKHAHGFPCDVACIRGSNPNSRAFKLRVRTHNKQDYNLKRKVNMCVCTWIHVRMREGTCALLARKSDVLAMGHSRDVSSSFSVRVPHQKMTLQVQAANFPQSRDRLVEGLEGKTCYCQKSSYLRQQLRSCFGAKRRLH